MNAERAAQPLGTPASDGFELLPIDYRITDLLVAHDGPAGICPSLARVAKLLGVSRRYVRKRIAALEAEGLVERVEVLARDDDPEWQRRLAAGFRPEDPGRRTSNTYRLATPRNWTAPPTPPVPRPLGTPTNPVGNGVSPAQPLGTQLPSGASSVPRVEEGKVAGWVEEGDEEESALIPPGPIELAIEPPATLQLDREPTRRQLDATLEAFGAVEVLSVRPNDGPVAAYRTARGRPIDLERAGVDDLRRAVDQLDRDTCLDGGCRPGDPCRRHTRRRRA